MQGQGASLTAERRRSSCVSLVVFCTGADVVRKLVVLARDCGLMLSADNVPVESLIPGELKDVASAAEFLELLPEVSDSFVPARK